MKFYPFWLDVSLQLNPFNGFKKKVLPWQSKLDMGSLANYEFDHAPRLQPHQMLGSAQDGGMVCKQTVGVGSSPMDILSYERSCEPCKIKISSKFWK